MYLFFFPPIDMVYGKRMMCLMVIDTIHPAPVSRGQEIDMHTQPDYKLERIDETSPLYTGVRRCYEVTCRGQYVGQLSIHADGYRDWSYIPGCPRPSASTQQRLLKSVRNDR